MKTHEDSLAYVNKLKDIFAKDETNDVVLDGLNSMYSSLKMEKEQTELLDAAIAKNPNNFVALANKGMMYIQKNDADNAIKCLKRVSTPGLRKYTGYKDMPRVINGLGVAILSTSKGVMTDKEASDLKIGGEVLCYIY